jgi:two-component system sensor histidine kinase RegB
MTTIDRSAAAMRVDQGADTPWYLAATPLVTLPWVIRLQWTMAAIALATAVLAVVIPSWDLLDHIASLLAASAIAHAAIARRLSGGRAVSTPWAGAAVALDIVLLTGLLQLTGGPLNPFAVVYVVYVTLAALTITRTWAFSLAGLSVLCYAVLIYWHTLEHFPVHHRLTDVPTHLLTMWLAATSTAELVIYFLVKASHALARREEELAAMRERTARSERLASLTTLAAGAAHELSTPLATIALASRELEHALDARRPSNTLLDDARLIRHEVDRCREILDQMSGRAGSGTSNSAEPIELTSILTDVRRRLPADRAERLIIHADDVYPMQLPRFSCTQAILALVKNAFDATPDLTLPVVAEVTRNNGTMRVIIRDQGMGLSPNVRLHAGEPFFTTKETGQGLGLGLFLARVFAEQFGGSVTLQPLGRGTEAVLTLPSVPHGEPREHRD